MLASDRGVLASWGCRYGLAIAATGLAVLARWSMPQLLTGTPYLAFYPAVVTAAAVGGLGPGLVATVVSLLCVDLLFDVTPGWINFGDPIDMGRLAIFLAGGVGTSVLAGLMRSVQFRERRQKELLAVTLASIGDAVIVTDAEGRVTFINGEAERLTGWRDAEASGQLLPGVFRIINEQSRQAAENPVDKVLRLGSVVGLANHTVLIAKDGRETPIDDSGAPIRDSDGTVRGVVLVFRDFSEQKAAQKALQESEQRVRLKLNSILSPEADIGDLELGDILDAPAVQALMGSFYELVHIPMAILDLKGRVLVGVGWQRICTEFHRVNAETCQHCIESDTLLTADVAPGEFKLYKCRNNMWDVATPITVGGRHMGNLFSGQFFFDDETPDRELFRSQARQYGFDEEAYLSALDAVPRLSRKAVNTAMTFFIRLADVLSQLSYSNIKLARSSEALRRSEEQLRAAALAGEIGVWSWLPGTNQVTVSANWRRLFGIPAGASVTLETWRDALHPEDRDGAVAELNAAVERHRDFDVQYRVVRPDGSMRWIVDRGRASYDEAGQALSMAGVNVDITEQKRAERELSAAKVSAERARAAAEQANAAKDHFLAVLSHELRTPLAPVLTAVAMLQERGDIEPGVRETLEMVRRNVELEARLIDDLLDLTRIVRGKVELERKRVDLRTVIARAVEVCRADIETRGLQFGVDIEPCGGYEVEADAARLQQVFWNLLKNAVKFTPHNGCAGIRCRAEEGYAVIEVSDSGIGIEQADLDRIFDAFEQAERSITRQFGGLGLGLAISKALVELHGGTIHAQSDGKGKGAMFRVRLPLAPTGRGEAAMPQSPQAVAQRPSSKPLRILLVEDHGDTAKMMRLLLASDGHEVKTAGDVATALQLAEQHAFDLLLSDLGLPDGSGHDLIRELRQRGHTMPGIALSGYGQEEDVQRSRRAGFAAHITKPTNPERLTEVISAVAGR